MGELIAILSGKGGTGKTSLCAGIAEALALQGEKILCIDCDVGLRNLDIALGISQIGGLSFLDVCSGGYSLDSATRHPVYPNIFFLTAPVSCPVEDINPADFSKMLENLSIIICNCYTHNYSPLILLYHFFIYISNLFNN
jgi:septum site-determining protein MinD